MVNFSGILSGSLCKIFFPLISCWRLWITSASGEVGPSVMYI